MDNTRITTQFYLSTCPQLNTKNRCNFCPFKTSRFS